MVTPKPINQRNVLDDAVMDHDAHAAMDLDDLDNTACDSLAAAVVMDDTPREPLAAAAMDDTPREPLAAAVMDDGTPLNSSVCVDDGYCPSSHPPLFVHGGSSSTANGGVARGLRDCWATVTEGGVGDHVGRR
nr:unnamed protein product [Digitaria exilis]